MNNPINHNKIWKYTLFIIAIMCIGIFLYFNDPLRSDWAPKCWFKSLTGFSCPACGFQRCLHALLHGDLINAIKFNLFLAIGVPYLLIVVIAKIFNVKYINNCLQTKMANIYLVTFFVWFIARNLYGI